MSFASNLSAELTSEDFKKMDALEYIEAVQCVSRLNAQLLYRPDNYAHIRGYSQNDVEALDSLYRADCFINKNLNLIQFNLFFNRFPEVLKSNYSKELFSHRIKRIILGLCREFIHRELSATKIKVIGKSLECPDIAGENLLFIWENGQMEHFPQFYKEDNS